MAASPDRILLNDQQVQSLAASRAIASLREFCKDTAVRDSLKDIPVVDVHTTLQQAFSVFSYQRSPQHFRLDEQKILLIDQNSEFSRGYDLAQRVLNSSLPGYLRLDNSYWTELVRMTSSFKDILGPENSSMMRMGEPITNLRPVTFNPGQMFPQNINRTDRGNLIRRQDVQQFSQQTQTAAGQIANWTNFLVRFEEMLTNMYHPILILLSEYGQSAFEAIPYGYKPNKEAIEWMASNLGDFDREIRPTLKDLLEIFFDEKDMEVPAYGSISLESLIGHQPIIYIEKSLAESPQGKEIIAAFNRMSEESRATQTVRKSPRKEAERQAAAAAAAAANPPAETPVPEAGVATATPESSAAVAAPEPPKKTEKPVKAEEPKKPAKAKLTAIETAPAPATTARLMPDPAPAAPATPVRARLVAED